MTEYDVGSTLKVLYSPFSADGHKAPLAAERDLTFEIIRAFRPFSLSVVGEVKPVGDQASLDLQLLLSQPFAPRNETGTFIIKLYDRRYDTNNREFRDKNRPYTEDREPAYHAYVSEYGDDVWWPDESDTGDDIEPGMVEAILENNNRRMFTLESEIYARITTGLLRGDRPAAPYFYGTVKYECAIGVVSGILIEYIHQSISVFDYLLSVGSCGYSDEAVRTVINRVGESLNSLMKYDFMNTDNRPEDILLWHPTGMSSDPKTWTKAELQNIRPVFIDFGVGRLRHPTETDRQWLYARWRRGESDPVECKIKIVMKRASRVECEQHGPSCWQDPLPKEGYRQFHWTLHIEDPYVFKPANEEEAEVIDIWEFDLGHDWGTYDAPYPRTMKELDELRNPRKSDNTCDAMPSDPVHLSSEERDDTSGTACPLSPALSPVSEDAQSTRATYPPDLAGQTTQLSESNARAPLTADSEAPPSPEVLLLDLARLSVSLDSDAAASSMTFRLAKSDPEESESSQEVTPTTLAAQNMNPSEIEAKTLSTATSAVAPDEGEASWRP